MSEAASFVWTNKREARLRELWDRGLTGGQIAVAMGTSRAAVLGKVRRLKLSFRVPKKTRGWSQAAKDRQARARIIRKVFGEQPKPPKPSGTLRADTWNALPGSNPVPLEKLSGCKWPIGQEAPYLFCGEAHAPARSYCPYHQAISTGIAPVDNVSGDDFLGAKAENASSGSGRFVLANKPATTIEAQEPWRAPADANTSVRSAA